jgi:hypothetical protein
MITRTLLGVLFDVKSISYAGEPSDNFAFPVLVIVSPISGNYILFDRESLTLTMGNQNICIFFNSYLLAKVTIVYS